MLALQLVRLRWDLSCGSCVRDTNIHALGEAEWLYLSSCNTVPRTSHPSLPRDAVSVSQKSTPPPIRPS